MMFPVAERMVHNLLTSSGWPGCVCFTGLPGSRKSDFIRQSIASLLCTDRNELGRRLDATQIAAQMQLGVHPDFVYFPAERVKIGERDEPGTIRHLLAAVLPYAPRYGRWRAVWFEDASLIRDEAETALLKSLEEPPAGTVFFLGVENPGSLKDTIISRSLVVPCDEKTDPGQVDADPWKRFLYLSGLADDLHWLAMSGISAQIREAVESLNLTNSDVLAYETIFALINDHFDKKTVDFKSQCLAVSLMPVLTALRDAMLEGLVPTMAPIRLPVADMNRLQRLARLTMTTIADLRRRIYGSRPMNIPLIWARFEWAWVLSE